MTVPPEPDLPVIHQRSYDVTAYRESSSRVRLRGQVRDTKPPGTYVPGDPDPLTVHHMIVDIVIEYPTMLIVEAAAVMDTHPHRECTTIEGHYDKLVGLSIARGFTHKVRELFGGPRGCTHTTALIQAMAPVAIQTMWSMIWPAHRCNDGAVVAADTGSYRPNAFGLYDMLGNVWEWTSSKYETDDVMPADAKLGCARDPLGCYVIRGGSWYSGPATVRAAVRRYLPAQESSESVGFRLLLEPVPKQML